ncbi:MAG: LTA synthase family protein [Peptoniphilus harei]|nr:LTA synthase family protein [Peptoniphilus harei]
MKKNYNNVTKILLFVINLIFYKTTLASPTSDKDFYILIISIILTGRLDYFLLNLYPKKNYKFSIIGLLVFIKIGLSIYFREFHSFNIFGRLGLAREASGVLPVIFKSFSPAYILMILSGLGLDYLINKYYIEDDFNKERFYKDIGIFFALLILPGLFIRPLRGTEVYTSTFLNPLYIKIQARQDLKSLDRTDIKKFFNSREIKLNEFTGLTKDKNIIFIQCESLQNAVVNKTYNGEEITPFLNSLIRSKGSIYFDNYFELLGFGNTSDAEFVSMTSVYPTLDGQAYSVYKNKTTYGLPKIAKKMGYETLAMHGNTGKFYDREEIYNDFDFDKIYLGESYDQTDQVTMGLSDKSFFNQSFEFLKEANKTGKKFFALMVTLTTHTPYNLPENLRELPKEKNDKTDFVYDYVSCAHYTDRAMEEFFDKLEKSGILDKTVIVIYGDHHAYTLNNTKNKESMERWLGREIDYDDMMNIPLVIHLPGYNKNITRHNIGSQVDLYPTILNLMGWDRKEIPTFGIDLLGWGKEVEDNAVYPQTYLLKGSFITSDKVFEYSRDGVFENSRLFDRKTRKSLPLEEAKKESDWAKICIDYCKNLMTNDNLKELLEKNKEG